eukprot:COSAG04_NODE_1980_length_5091_cov_5.303085_3_plen_68_part_00
MECAKMADIRPPQALKQMNSRGGVRVRTRAIYQTLWSACDGSSHWIAKNRRREPRDVHRRRACFGFS